MINLAYFHQFEIYPSLKAIFMQIFVFLIIIKTNGLICNEHDSNEQKPILNQTT